MNVYRHIADTPTLEREYSPSSCIPDLSIFLRAYAERSACTRATAAHFRTFRYGNSDVECLDYFPATQPALPAVRRPLVVYIHGGYWQELGKDDHSFPAQGFGEQGISYIALSYGLAPQSSLGQMIDRCRRALAWIVRNCDQLGIDSACIHLSGCSAGAYLAAMTALADWNSYGLDGSPIRSLILLSGIFDLRPLPLTYINRLVGITPADALCNSPLLQVDATSVRLPPTLVAYGEIETSEFKRQATEFAEAVGRRGGDAQLHAIAGRNHFNLIFDLAEADTLLGSLVSRHMRLANRIHHRGAQ